MGCWCTSAPSLLFFSLTNIHVRTQHIHTFAPSLHPNPLSMNTDGSQCSSSTSFSHRDSSFSPWSLCICKWQFLLSFRNHGYGWKISTPHSHGIRQTVDERHLVNGTGKKTNSPTEWKDGKPNTWRCVAKVMSYCLQRMEYNNYYFCNNCNYACNVSSKMLISLNFLLKT